MCSLLGDCAPMSLKFGEMVVNFLWSSSTCADNEGSDAEKSG